jgi:hypothetical protein
MWYLPEVLKVIDICRDADSCQQGGDTRGAIKWRRHIDIEFPDRGRRRPPMVCELALPRDRQQAIIEVLAGA